MVIVIIHPLLDICTIPRMQSFFGGTFGITHFPVNNVPIYCLFLCNDTEQDQAIACNTLTKSPSSPNIELSTHFHAPPISLLYSHKHTFLITRAFGLSFGHNFLMMVLPRSVV